MNWINLAKQILDSSYSSRRLKFLSLAVLMENIDRTIEDDRNVLINACFALSMPAFMQCREMQSWPMSEYSKRLPGFLAKSRPTIN